MSFAFGWFIKFHGNHDLFEWQLEFLVKIIVQYIKQTSIFDVNFFFFSSCRWLFSLYRSFVQTANITYAAAWNRENRWLSTLSEILRYILQKYIIFSNVHACTYGESRARMDRVRVRSIVGSILSAFSSRIRGYFSTARPSTYSTDRRIENYIKFFSSSLCLSLSLSLFLCLSPWMVTMGTKYICKDPPSGESAS